MPLLRFLLLLPLYILRFVWTALTLCLWIFSKIASPLIGKVEWTAPSWMASVKKLFDRVEHFIKEYPLRIGAVLLVGVISTFASIYGYHWYINRPGVIEIAPTTYQTATVQIANAPTPLNYRNQHPTIDKLVLNFNLQAAPLEAINDPVQNGIELSPKTQGEWRWNASGTQLIFTPKNEWRIAQKYTITLSPQILLSQTVKTETTKLEFSTQEMRISLGENEFYQDPTNPSQKKSIFHVKFNYPVDVASFEKAIELTMTTPKDIRLAAPKFSVMYNDSKMDAWIHSAPLTLPDDLSKMKLLIKKGVRSSKQDSNEASEISSSMNIPGLYTLRLSQVKTAVVKNEKDKYEQVLSIQSSDAIKGSDLAQAATLWLLPEKNSKYPETEHFQWYSSVVTEQVLAESTKLPFKLVDTPQEYEKVQNFTFKADPNRYIFVKFNFDKAMQSVGGYKHKGNITYTLKVQDYPSLLQFMAKGSILPLQGERKIAIAAQNVPGMKLGIKRVSPTQLHHLLAFNNNSDFTHMDFGEEDLENHFVERFSHTQAIFSKTPEAVNYESIDLTPYFSKHDQGKKGVFLLRLIPWNTTLPDEQQNTLLSPTTSDSRFIVVTDLGMIVKRSLDHSSDVFVQSLSSGNPVANATVSVIAQNGVALLSKTTDASGHVLFSSLDDYTDEKTPMMYTVEKGDDLSFLPVKETTSAGAERSLNLSRFDTGGIQNAKDGEIKAYLFSDRKVYRPGDTFNIGAIVRANKWDIPLKGVPLLAEIYDSRNVLMQKKSLTLDESGLNELSYTTQENAPTGEWHIYLYAIEKADQRRTLLGHTNVTIKEFEPDRLHVKIDIQPKSSKFWLKPEDLNATVNVQNLFGTPAQNLRVSTTLTLSPASPSFAPFKEYTFYEDHSKTQIFTSKIEDALTNQEGNAQLKLGLEHYAPASYYVELLSEAFEAQSGRSIVATSKTLISPYDFFIGAKADGEMDYIKKDVPRNLHFIAINPLLQQTSVSKLKLLLFEKTYISVLTQQQSGVYKYESKPKETLIKEEPLPIDDKGYNYALPTDKAGNFMLVVKDELEHTLYKTSFNVAGNANVTRSLERNAELKLALSKKEYQAGENIEISINAPYTGSGLITIERDKVYAWKWFKTDTTSSTQTIQLPKGIDGNAYVNVQFVRDQNANEIFMSPLSYGVAPFSINIEKHRSDLTLKTPESIKPGTTLPIVVQSPSKQKVIVFAVDEGILQVARYQFQDPLSYFFQKKRLNVDSFQILDLILPEFSKLKELSAPGGDLSALAQNMHLNPFKRKNNKAVAFWSGIIEVEGEQTLTYDVPDYFNGKLRVMAISVTPERIGSTQTTTLVQGDFVLSPNAPFVAAPKDTFEVALSVANNLDTNGSTIPITISAQTSKHLRVLEKATQTLSLSGKSEGVVIFKMQAEPLLGNAEIVFTANYAQTSIQRKETLSIRPLVPYRASVVMGQMGKGEEVIKNLRNMYDAYAKRSASVSHSPLVLADGLARYLEHYPYTCSEQIVSRTMPALFINQHPELDTQEATKLRERLRSVFDTLRTRQNSAGGFGLWGATIQSDPYASAYIVQFLLEAKEQGYTIPEDMLQKATTYLQSLASDETKTDAYGLRLRAFAIYLLTRENKVTTNLLSTVQSRLQNRFGDEWKKELTALYLAASYKMLKMDKEAALLLQEPWKHLENAYTNAWWSKDYNDPLIQNTTVLYLVVKHFPERVHTIPPRALENMALMLRAERYTSLSSAMSILALEAYSATLKKNEGVEQLGIKALNEQNQARLISSLQGFLARGTFLENDKQILFDNPNALPAWYVVTQEGFDKAPQVEAIKNGLEIVRTYTDEKGTKIDHVTIGEQINVHLFVRSISSDSISNIAIVDLIPGGFEIVQQTPKAQETDSISAVVQTQNGAYQPMFAQAREDRMIIMTDVGKTSQEFTYHIKANSVGEFMIPSAFAEAMYDRAIQALSPAEGILHVNPASAK